MVFWRDRRRFRIGVELAAAAAPVFLAMSLLPECHRWSERALLALDEGSRGGHEEMQLQAGLGISLMFTRGNNDPAHVALNRSLAIAEEHSDVPNMAGLLGMLHMYHLRGGDFRTALQYAEHSSKVASRLGDAGIGGPDALLGQQMRHRARRGLWTVGPRAHEERALLGVGDAAGSSSPTAAITSSADQQPRAQRPASRPRRAQRVADAAHGLDQRRAVRVELLAQVADVGLEHARVAAEVVVPHVVEDLRAGQHAARVEHQVAQQPVLGGGQLDRLAAARDLVRVLVELEVLEDEPADSGSAAPLRRRIVRMRATSSSRLNGLVT